MIKGSSGIALVTENSALLWTDGRYYLQATKQLDANWKLMRDGQPETPSIADWLIQNIPSNSYVGIDSSLYEESLFQALAAKLKEHKCELVDTIVNLIDIVWNECGKPVFEDKPLIKLDKSHTGLSVKQKLNKIHEQMKKLSVDAMVVSSLDEIAWLLNMRGQDIPFGTVFYAYCIITPKVCKLFTKLNRLNSIESPENDCFRSHLLNEENFEFFEYDSFFKYFQDFIKTEFIQTKNMKKIFLSNSSSHAIHAVVPAEFAYKDSSYLTQLRVIKNSHEIEAAKQVHLRDSVVLVEFFHRIQNYFKDKKNQNFEFELNEFNLAKYLDEMRLKTSGCMCPSFETICSIGSNGAIIHYKPEIHSSKKIESEQILLLDSGGHYLDMGTTDVTRTVFLGDTNKITSYQKECFTRVLKGHIQLAIRTFPSGTKAELLDSFARGSLWQAGLDYRHGKCLQLF